MAKISMGKLAGLFRRMGTSYRAGIDLQSIVKRESETGQGSLKQQMKLVSDGVSQGEALNVAMKNTNGAFPELVLATISAGEQGGRLEDSFDRLAKHYENLTSFRRTTLMLMAWPIFELSFAIVVIGFLILIMEWATSSGNMDSIDWLGLGLSGTAYFFLYWTTILIILASGAIFCLGVFKGWFGIFPLRIARYVPLLGPIIMQLSLSRFAWTLGIAINAGVNAMNSVQMALRSTQNFFYSRHENDIALRVREGAEIHSALRSVNEFPDELIMYVENGETSGELPEMMEHLSATFQSRAERNLKTLSVVGFAGTFLMIAVIMVAAILFLFTKLYLGPINEAANY